MRGQKGDAALFVQRKRAASPFAPIVKAEFTAIIEAAPEGGYWAMCPEIPGANGQGDTVEQAKESLKAAIELILEDRREDILRGLPVDAIQATVSVE